MIDTNIVVDAFASDMSRRDWALNKMAIARRSGDVAVSAIVVGELAVRNPSHQHVSALLSGLGLRISDLSSAAAHRAGVAQRQYRESGGRRESLLGDFLIGAHAEVAEAVLLTRDARRYRTYFPDLSLITPDNDND